MDIILNKYLPFCSLYTGLMLNNSPVSNALVENYFGQLKQITLEGQKNLKCSQFVRKLREDVVSIKTEVDIGIRKSRLTKTDPSDEKCSQERWAKRGKKAGTHFMGKYLQNVSSAVINDTILYPEDDKDTAQCGYCGQGMLDETTLWVQCDTCDVSTGNKNKTYSGDFVCKLCTLINITGNTQNNWKLESLSIHESCEAYLKSMQMSSIERIHLELSTKFQRNSTIWREHKIRATSSFFGRICKSKEASSFKNIINFITTDRTINTPATIHGTMCEDLAREAYVKQTNTTSTCRIVPT
ncbi:hypothetical protein QE152_g10434 [Popillia japonica]|uniref:Transposase n=1 Tax=Popillia japonica TaxID=7064 RepID=A0AAW1LV74_POPJA